jgi:Na+-driven multidrug efflux pump
MKMVGVAIASCVQFICRFLIMFVCAKTDKELSKSFIPLFHEDSFKDLGYVLEIGWQSFLLKVMGWWAFDVFT